MSVRLRVDGVLHPLNEIPADRMGGIVSRIKIMGDIDIARRGCPKTGVPHIGLKSRTSTCGSQQFLQSTGKT